MSLRGEALIEHVKALGYKPNTSFVNGYWQNIMERFELPDTLEIISPRTSVGLPIGPHWRVLAGYGTDSVTYLDRYSSSPDSLSTLRVRPRLMASTGGE